MKNAYLSNTKEGEAKGKKHKTKLKTNVNRSLWRDKVANRSVGSINSMEANGSQKETLWFVSIRVEVVLIYLKDGVMMMRLCGQIIGERIPGFSS